MKKLNKELFSNQHFLFVFDLDGTLLNSKKEIEPKTKELLQELVSLGNIVTLASGRPPRAVLPYYRHLGLTAPLISYNGALISYDDGNEPLQAVGYTVKEIADFFSHFPESSFKNVMIEDDDNLYYSGHDDAYDFFFHPEQMNVHYGEIVPQLQNDAMAVVLENKDTSRNKEIEEFVLSHYQDIAIRFWYDAPTFGEFYHYN
ncbi:MAG: HAD-IIB family hydrolase, partial [Bacilli bacterium]